MNRVFFSEKEKKSTLCYDLLLLVVGAKFRNERTNSYNASFDFPKTILKVFGRFKK